MVKSSTSMAAISPAVVSDVDDLDHQSANTRVRSSSPCRSMAIESPSRKIQPTWRQGARSGRAGALSPARPLSVSVATSPMVQACAPVVSCTVTSGCSPGAGGHDGSGASDRVSGRSGAGRAGRAGRARAGRSAGEEVPARPHPGQDQHDAEDRSPRQALQHDGGAGRLGARSVGTGPQGERGQTEEGPDGVGEGRAHDGSGRGGRWPRLPLRTMAAPRHSQRKNTSALRM